MLKFVPSKNYHEGVKKILPNVCEIHDRKFLKVPSKQHYVLYSHYPKGSDQQPVQQEMLQGPQYFQVLVKRAT